MPATTMARGKPGYYSEYATPSPVGQTPPQLPGPNSDPYAASRRPVDVRRSPTQSSTASDRSSEEVSQEMRMRQISQLREQQQHAAQVPRPYPPPPRQRHDSFAYEGQQPIMLRQAASTQLFVRAERPSLLSRTEALRRSARLRSSPPPTLRQRLASAGVQVHEHL